MVSRISRRIRRTRSPGRRRAPARHARPSPTRRGAATATAARTPGARSSPPAIASRILGHPAGTTGGCASTISTGQSSRAQQLVADAVLCHRLPVGKTARADHDQVGLETPGRAARWRRRRGRCRRGGSPLRDHARARTAASTVASTSLLRLAADLDVPVPVAVVNLEVPDMRDLDLRGRRLGDGDRGVARRPATASLPSVARRILSNRLTGSMASSFPPAGRRP